MLYFRFANPEYLYLLSIVPLLAGWFIYTIFRKRMALKKFGDPAILAHLMPGASKGRPIVKFSFLLAAIIGVIGIIARPQFGSKYETVKRHGIEVVIALDVSNSMLAEDDSRVNRLEQAKRLIYKLLEGMNNDKLGIVVFAGKSYTQLPMTSDYQAAKMYIASISPNLIPQQGTAIGAAINMSARSFSQREEVARSIIVITDGENHEDDAVGAAKEAHEKGIQVNVVGMGKTSGSPIPVAAGTNNFRKDKSGNTVISKLNEQMAQEIAAAGGGIYVRADNSNISLIQNELSKASKADIETKVYSEYDEQFHVIAWIVLILLLLEFCLLERRNKFLSKIELFS